MLPGLVPGIRVLLTVRGRVTACMSTKTVH